MKFSTILSRLVVCCAAFAASVATAAPLTWTLQGVTFFDGGTATGSFIIDSDNGNMLAWDIVTTDGSVRPGFAYDPSNSNLVSDRFGPNSYSIVRKNPFAQPYVNFGFDSALTAAGAVNFRYSFNENGSWECGNCDAIRYITAGSVTSAANAVPEPSSVALFGIALAGFALRRRSKF